MQNTGNLRLTAGCLATVQIYDWLLKSTDRRTTPALGWRKEVRSWRSGLLFSSTALYFPSVRGVEGNSCCGLEKENLQKSAMSSLLCMEKSCLLSFGRQLFHLVGLRAYKLTVATGRSRIVVNEQSSHVGIFLANHFAQWLKFRSQL